MNLTPGTILMCVNDKSTVYVKKGWIYICLAHVPINSEHSTVKIDVDGHVRNMFFHRFKVLIVA
jgi:hypothetical protein